MKKKKITTFWFVKFVKEKLKEVFIKHGIIIHIPTNKYRTTASELERFHHHSEIIVGTIFP